MILEKAINHKVTQSDMNLHTVQSVLARQMISTNRQYNHSTYTSRVPVAQSEIYIALFKELQTCAQWNHGTLALAEAAVVL